MFRFELSPWAPNRHQGFTSSPRTSVLPTFDYQSAIAKPCRKLRQPLIVSARNACVKRESRNFRGFPTRLFTRPAPLAPHPDGLVRRVRPGSRRALILPTEHRRNNPYFRGLSRVSRPSRASLHAEPRAPKTNARTRPRRTLATEPRTTAEVPLKLLHTNRPAIRLPTAMGRVGIEPTT